MYIANGYVHASIPADFIKVDHVRIVDDFCMLVTFDTGETRLFDASELFQYEAFAPLADSVVFKDYSIEHGTLTWLNGEIDIAPEGLYRRTYEYHPSEATSLVDIAAS